MSLTLSSAPGLTSIHAALHKLAEDGPDRPALICDSQTISRRALDDWSNAIAGRLADEGVRQGDIVPIAIAPSPVMIAAALGVMRLGAAYAVMDREWSMSRLEQINAILGGAIALSDSENATGAFQRELTLSHFASGPTDRALSLASVNPTDVATVFFTSGSEGEPKAVLSSHQATMRLFGPDGLPHFDQDTVMPHLGSSAWDALPFEVWGPLLRGGVSALKQHRALSPDELRHEISVNGVNLIFFTTSLFHVLVDEDASSFAGLRAVYVGGEELSPTHAGRFLASHPDVPLINGYGPAEATCFALTHRVVPEDISGAIPLGTEVPRTRVHVLADERECQPGEVGELCVSGDGVSRGYLGDEILTASKFVDVVIGGKLTRVYRTGDFGSRTSSGVFQFSGRRDREVKVRGNRIELGLVERKAVLIPGVAQAAAVPLVGLSGRPESLALAVVCKEVTFDVRSVRQALEHALPPGWVPEVIVRLTSLPLTSRGKLDQTALRAAIANESPEGMADTDPGGWAICAPDSVAAAFSSVLGGVNMGPQESLFDQGGTSLTAVRLCRALSDLTGLSIPASVVISRPTIEAMTSWISEHSEADSESSDVDRAESARLTGMQSGLLFQHVDGDDTQNHAHLAWRVSPGLDVQCLLEALRDVHDRHHFLHGRYVFGEFAMWNDNGLDVDINTLSASEEEAGLDLMLEALDAPFSLFAGHVWRVALCEIEETGSHLLGVSIHHIAFDGWSVGIFVQDLADAYAARREGKQPKFVRNAIAPSAIYAEMERMRRLADLPAQHEYWRRQLHDMPVGPAPWVCTESQNRKGIQRLDVLLSDEQRAAIGHRSIGSGLLPHFVAALSAALAEVSGGDDFTMGIPVSQRSTPELQRPIACLINMVCLRLREPAGDGAASRAQRVALAGLAHSDLAIAEVARVAGYSGHPLYQMIGAVQDSPSAELRLEGSQVTAIDLPYLHLAAPLLVELMAPDGDAASIRVAYDTALVSDAVASSVGAGVVARLC
jgi:mycobactin peptide synthetase MbtE